MTAYRANRPRFVDETVDGEALIMDMVKGTYYSCVGASTIAWNVLKESVEPEVAAKLLSTAYGVDLDRVRDDVERFVARLLEEEALVVHDGPAMSSPPPALDSPSADYQPLAIERYTDLADLILLDPVHDVTDAGWPNEPT